MTGLRTRRYAGAFFVVDSDCFLWPVLPEYGTDSGRAISQSCISWRVSGICYWLHCSWSGCQVRTSVKVSHFIPEAVVSTYTAPGGNPWRKWLWSVRYPAVWRTPSVAGLRGYLPAGETRLIRKSPGQRKSAIRFKYADALGHPATLLIGGATFPGIRVSLLPHPLMPYFLSTLDSLAWRTGMPESLYPEAMIPGRRELGNQRNADMWGNIYPRSGFVSQTDDDKAAALVAQRVADIITRTGEPHVYQSLKGRKGCLLATGCGGRKHRHP